MTIRIRRQKRITLCECGCGQPTRLSDRTWARYGMRKGQPLRFIKGHNAKGRRWAKPTAEKPPKPPTHGMSVKGSKWYPFWCAWSQMRQRCYNPKQTSYKYYGARGIKVCERWESFECFKEDMLATWYHGASLDRRKGNEDYSPTNCRWSTQTQQVRNRRNTIMVSVSGEAMPLATAVEMYGVAEYAVVSNRIRRQGWGAIAALSTPVRFRTKG